jgi:hypothetical protein
MAIKICNKIANGMLATHFMFVYLPVAQMPPKQGLGLGLLLPVLTGEAK